jgi:SulP family sulfate permease
MVNQFVNFGPRARRALNDVLGGSAASVLSITFGLSCALLIPADRWRISFHGVAATFISPAVVAAALALGSSLPPRSEVLRPTAATIRQLAASLVEAHGCDRSIGAATYADHARLFHNRPASCFAVLA